MKYIKYLLVMIFAVMVSVSCSSDDDSTSDSNALVGTWGLTAMDEGDELKATFIFNANKTGSLLTELTYQGMTDSYTENFTWATSGNKLTLTSSNSDPEILTYSISGNKLSITDDTGETIVFTKQ